MVVGGAVSSSRVEGAGGTEPSRHELCGAQALSEECGGERDGRHGAGLSDGSEDGRLSRIDEHRHRVQSQHAGQGQGLSEEAERSADDCPRVRLLVSHRQRSVHQTLRIASAN